MVLLVPSEIEGLIVSCLKVMVTAESGERGIVEKGKRT